MFTIKVMRPTEIFVRQASEVTILTQDHEELKVHIADCDIKCANQNLTDSDGKPLTHSDMIAALFYDNRTSYLFPGDSCYITNENNKTVFSI